MSRNVVAWICKGREFQRVGADSEKARTPLEVVVLGTVKRSWFVERRLRVGVYGERIV